jgi:hypothetical protein
MDPECPPQAGTGAATSALPGVFVQASGVEISVRPLIDAANWRAQAEMVFTLDAGLTAGYRGFYRCNGDSSRVAMPPGTGARRLRPSD